MIDSIIRYVVTYVNREGMREIAGPSQGRFTFTDADDAECYLRAVLSNTSKSTINQIWGDNPQFEVRPVPCYPGHFDPKTRWFD